MNEALRHIAAQRAIPVIRAASTADAVDTARACARAGLRVVELTFTVPDVTDALEELRHDDLVLGVGTVTNPRQVVNVARAGAQFVVSFANPPGMVPTAHRHGLAAIPGAFTASEVLRCAEDGADAVKIFPARLASPAYVADLAAVLPDVPLVVTGGIKALPQSYEPWLHAGAIAVGLGSDIGTVAAHGADEVRRRAARVREATPDGAEPSDIGTAPANNRSGTQASARAHFQRGGEST